MDVDWRELSPALAAIAAGQGGYDAGALREGVEIFTALTHDHIALEESSRFWPRLEELSPESLFIWGKRDTLVPIGFARHVRRALPAAQHVELDCGHVPQLECPRKVHAAIERFLKGVGEPKGARTRVAASAIRRAARSA